MLKVYYTLVSDLPSETEGLALSDYRRQKLDKTASVEKQKQNIAVELLLNYAVKTAFPDAEIPCEITLNDFGKPSFSSIPLYFNLSHSGNYAACAISDKPVGIDIESRSGFNKQIADRFYTEFEKAVLYSSKNEEYDFYRIWTAKESALKYLGCGLSRALSSAEVISEDFIVINPENIKLRISHSFIDGFHLSVCSSEEIKTSELIKVQVYN